MKPKSVADIAASRQEAKRDRFERLAQRRVTETIRSLRLIGNLANRSNYDYSQHHVRQIVDALETEFKQLKQRFRNDETAGENAFVFKK